jgi:integrase
MGTKVLTRSLQTRDESEALRRRHKVIAELQALIESVAPTEVHRISPADLVEKARLAHQAVEAGELDPKDAEYGFDATVEDFLDHRISEYGADEAGEAKLPPAESAMVGRAYRVLSGSAALTLGHQVAKYLVHVAASELRRQTVDDKRRHLDSFMSWLGSDFEVAKVTKVKAAAYLDEVLVPRDVSVQTKRNALNEVRQFFDWMEVRGAVPANPFDKVGRLLKESKRGREQARRPWTPEELAAVLQHVPPDDPVWALTALGAYTGARREDLCALPVTAVDEQVLKISEGKTQAAVRRVPVHPVIRPLVRRLIATSTDGYLLSGLLTGGRDNKRGHYIGKRFSRILRDAGVTDPRVVFHAFRNTVLTQMEAAGVELSLRQQIAGHEPETVTEKVYTADAADERRAAAIAHVSYGEAVDELIRSTGAELTITRVAKRRGTKTRR